METSDAVIELVERFLREPFFLLFLLSSSSILSFLRFFSTFFRRFKNCKDTVPVTDHGKA